ncbi:MAG TPA: hypothetical protein VF590_27490, partial [Isosphaeraceae bacterium]
AATFKTIAVLKGHSGLVWSATFSPDGTRVATASGDGTGRVWDAATGKLIAALKGHTSDVAWAAFSPDGARVVTASRHKTARVWSLEPIPGDAGNLPPWVDLFTGYTLEGGAVRPLSTAEWLGRHRELGSNGP